MYTSPPAHLRNLALRDWPVADIEHEVRKRRRDADNANDALERAEKALDYAKERESG